MSTTTSPPTTTPPPPPPTTTTPPPPPTTTTPPPTTTTPPPTTTTPPPSGCPCEYDSVFVAINTKYFANILDENTRFILPCSWINLPRNPEKNCTYETVSEVDLYLYNKPKNFTNIENTVVTISATLNHDDEIDKWVFTWKTNFEFDEENEIFIATYYSNEVTEENCNIFGNYQLDTPEDDEVVCVRELPAIDDNDIDENIDFKIKRGGDLLFRCNTLKMLQDQNVSPIIIYGSPHMYRIFDLPDNRPQFDDYNSKSNAVTLEMFVNLCTNKKFFKAFHTSLRDRGFEYYYYIQDTVEPNKFFLDDPNEDSNGFPLIELEGGLGNCNKCKTHDDILTSEKEIDQKINEDFRSYSNDEVEDGPHVTTVAGIQWFVVDNDTFEKFSNFPNSIPDGGVGFSSNYNKKNDFDINWDPFVEEEWKLLKQIGVSYGFIDSDFAESSLEKALEIVKELSDEFKYGIYQTIFDINSSDYARYLPFMNDVLQVEIGNDTYTFNIYKLLEINNNNTNFIGYDGSIVKYSDDCYGFKIYWYLNVGKKLFFTELKQYAEIKKFIRIVEPDELIAINDKFINTQFIFEGLDGDIANIRIDGNEFTIKNDGNQLVFDFDGDQEYVFTSINESVVITTNDSSYEVTFDGYGSLLFTVKTITPRLDYFDTYITSSNTGVTITNPLSRNIEIGINIIDDEDLDDRKLTYDVLGVKLEVDTAYNGSIFSVLFKDSDIVVYLSIDGIGFNSIIAYDTISNTGTKVCAISLLDHTKIPNTLPRITSSNGVEIVSLVDGYTGISFDPIDDSELTGNLIEVTVEGNVFLIDEAYDGRTFVLNELRTPTNNKSTLFTFYANRNVGVNIFRTSRVIDSEFLRMRLLGYF